MVTFIVHIISPGVAGRKTLLVLSSELRLDPFHATIIDFSEITTHSAQITTNLTTNLTTKPGLLSAPL